MRSANGLQERSMLSGGKKIIINQNSDTSLRIYQLPEEDSVFQLWFKDTKIFEYYFQYLDDAKQLMSNVLDWGSLDWRGVVAGYHNTGSLKFSADQIASRRQVVR